VTLVANQAAAEPAAPASVSNSPPPRPAGAAIAEIDVLKGSRAT
jgi:hypothetical protein